MLNHASKIPNLVILIACLFLLQSCDKQIAEFPLTIVNAGKLAANKDTPYPTYFSDLCNPYLSNNKTNFSPMPVTIDRIDMPNGNLTLAIGVDAKKSNTNSIAYRKNMAKKFFETATIGTLLSQDSTSNFDKQTVINNYISNLSKKSKIFYFSKNPQSDTYNNSKLYDNVDSLRKSITDALQENPGTNIYIILNPLTSQTKTVIQNTVDTNKKQNVVIDSGVKQINQPISSSGNASLKTDCGSYDGDMRNGKPDGVGTMYYSMVFLISPYDNKNRMTEIGDYITGHWKNGYLDVGTWYDKNRNEKGKLTIGVPQ